MTVIPNDNGIVQLDWLYIDIAGALAGFTAVLRFDELFVVALVVVVMAVVAVVVAIAVVVVVVE